jgi:hypothetical protein
MMGLPFCEQRVHCPLKAESSVKLVSKHPNTHDKHNVFEKQHCNTTNTLDQQFNLYTISPNRSIVIYLRMRPSRINQRHAIQRHRPTLPNPLRLNAQENPHPPAQNLKHLNQENPALKIAKSIQVHAQLDAPRAAQQ